MTATTTRGQDRSAAGAARPTSATARNRADRRADGPLSGLRALARRADSPVTSYYLLVGATTALVLTGLVMVLSASMVTAYKSRGSVFSVFGNRRSSPYWV